MSKRDAKLLLEDMLDSMSKIRKYTFQYSFDDFCRDDKTIDAVIRNFEIIGEAANRIPDELKLNNPEIPWRSLIGLRNRVIHEYFGVDLEIVWDIVTNDLNECSEWIELLIDKEFR
jgi:uncharacterized protein with HEPN domain